MDKYKTAGLLICLLFVAVAIFFPVTAKFFAGPQLVFMKDGKLVDLSPQAQARIVRQMEGMVAEANSTSDTQPEKFNKSFFSDTPKLVEIGGSYFRITYPGEKNFSTSAGVIKAKYFYIGILDYANLPGWPGGVFLVGGDGHLIQFTSPNLTLRLEGLAADDEIYPRLAPMMQRSVALALFGYVNKVKEEELVLKLKLARAVEKGDVSEVKKLVDHGADLHEILPGKSTLLFFAGSPEMADYLIGQGVSIEELNRALFSICYNTDLRRPQETVAPIARVLLKHGADPNYHTADWSLLVIARDAATVDALVEYGADVHAKIRGHGILDELDIGYRELPYYQALAAHGLAIDNRENGIHLLNHASYSEQMDIVNWLLDRGVDPNGTDIRDGSYDGFVRKPLTEAARIDGDKVAGTLIQHGAKIDDDVVNCALVNERQKVLKVFWESGARNLSELLYDVTQDAPVEKLEVLLKGSMPADPSQDKYMTPLAMAVIRGKMPTVKVLVEHGADPNKKLETNAPQYQHVHWTALAYAACMGQEDMVEYFLEHGGRPDADVMSFLMHSFYIRGHMSPTNETYYKIIQQMLDAGAFKGLPREQMAGRLFEWDGATDLKVTKMFMAAGLDPTAKDDKGKNAIELVQERVPKFPDARGRAHLAEVIAVLGSK